MNENRSRGIIGLAVTWGVALSAFATSTLAVGVASGLVPGSIFGPREFIAVAIRGLIAGAVTGSLFGWLLSSRERGQNLSTLSRGRVALWSFLAAGAVPVLLALAAGGPALPLVVVAAGALGAGVGGSFFGLGLLSLARREPSRLIGASDEKARLLGE